MSIMQGLISLFTTGGKINPFAIALLLGASFYLYNDYQGYRDRQELARQCEVYREAAQDKITQLNRSNSNVAEATKSITKDAVTPDDINEWVNRVNGMQRESK